MLQQETDVLNPWLERYPGSRQRLTISDCRVKTLNCSIYKPTELVASVGRADLFPSLWLLQNQPGRLAGLSSLSAPAKGQGELKGSGGGGKLSISSDKKVNLRGKVGCFLPLLMADPQPGV